MTGPWRCRPCRDPPHTRFASRSTSARCTATPHGRGDGRSARCARRPDTTSSRPVPAELPSTPADGHRRLPAATRPPAVGTRRPAAVDRWAPRRRGDPRHQLRRAAEPAPRSSRCTTAGSCGTPTAAHRSCGAGAVLRRAIRPGLRARQLRRHRRPCSRAARHRAGRGRPPRPLPPAPAAASLAQPAWARRCDGRPFVLAIGTVERRKNLPCSSPRSRRWPPPTPTLRLVLAAPG